MSRSPHSRTHGNAGRLHVEIIPNHHRLGLVVVFTYNDRLRRSIQNITVPMDRHEAAEYIRDERWRHNPTTNLRGPSQ